MEAAERGDGEGGRRLRLAATRGWFRAAASAKSSLNIPTLRTTLRKMAGLQRSSQTFRRSGSSGLVWDEKLMSDGHSERDQEGEALELRHSHSVGSIGLQHRRGDGAAHSRCNNSQAFHTRCVPPAQDPPSPKVPGCIFCGIFRKTGFSEPSKPRRF